MITTSVMAMNHSRSEAITAVVQLHSKSRTTCWACLTRGNPKNSAPTTTGGMPAAARKTSTGRYFVDKASSPRVIVISQGRLTEPHYIGGRDPRAVAGPPAVANGLGG